MATWRVSGWAWCRPVKVWFNGADCTTLSLANWDADGGTMDKPGGALLFEPDLPVPNVFASEGLIPSGPSSLADFWSLASMMQRCWSRTERLRCSCSRRTGSWVWKPGDKQAMPTCCILTPSRAVIGPPGGLAESPPEVGRLEERSSLRGRGRVL